MFYLLLDTAGSSSPLITTIKTETKKILVSLNLFN